MNWLQKSESIKQRATRLMDRLAELGGSVGLPNAGWPVPDDMFWSARHNLDRQEFDIAVCGDVSQGKSAFINALVGEQLLPSNEHPTTSQLFRITNAPVREFKFVFTDGTAQAFESPDDLLRHGTVLCAQESIGGKIIDYIDIRMPLEHIPPSIHLWDTPGLGVTHFSHEEITCRCISRCDAFLFLSRPERPLTDQELDFIEKALSATGECIFVQTMIDKYNADSAETVARRNEEILRQRFGMGFQEKYRRTPDFRFVPCSSQNFLKSLERKNDTAKKRFFELSRFGGIHEALENLLFRTTCMAVVLPACEESAKFHDKLAAGFDESAKLLAARSDEEREAMQIEKRKQKDEFELNWGNPGIKRIGLERDIQRIFKTAADNALCLFSRKAELHDRFVRDVDALTSEKAVIALQERLAEKLPGAVSRQWQGILAETRTALQRVSERFSGELALPGEGSGVVLGDVRWAAAVRESSLCKTALKTLAGVKQGALAGGFVGGAAVALGYMLAPATGGTSLIVAAGLGALSEVLGQIWGGTTAFNVSRQEALESAKASVVQAIDNYFGALERAYAMAPIGQASRIEAAFEGLQTLAWERFRSILGTERKNHENACARLDAQALLEGENALKEEQDILLLRTELGKWQTSMEQFMKELAEAVA